MRRIPRSYHDVTELAAAGAATTGSAATLVASTASTASTPAWSLAASRVSICGRKCTKTPAVRARARGEGKRER